MILVRRIKANLFFGKSFYHNRNCEDEFVLFFTQEQFIDLLQYCWINNYPVSCSFSTDAGYFTDSSKG
jgi:hypothetical protein